MDSKWLHLNGILIEVMKFTLKILKKFEKNNNLSKN